ncbi:MAG: redoxin domain-containing protein [Proteobacteria bacterium]|nr:redoxin domain-containing protein [Patescibacteria group bacterium]MBU4319447.1 redoxin domain-containing protein [Pseudomonadota bacterium]
MTHHRLKIGDQAPEFTLINQQDKKMTPMSLNGKRILLSFHPLAWTPVCEIQMRTLELKKDIFDEFEVIAFGISVDSAQSKKAWAKSMGVKDTNLLADFWPHGEIAEKYGLFIEDIGVSERANVLIGLDRTIEWIKVYEMPQVPDIEEIIHFISSKKQ